MPPRIAFPCPPQGGDWLLGNFRNVALMLQFEWYWSVKLSFIKGLGACPPGLRPYAPHLWGDLPSGKFFRNGTLKLQFECYWTMKFSFVKRGPGHASPPPGLPSYAPQGGAWLLGIFLETRP